jgi:hypothetical protein
LHGDAMSAGCWATNGDGNCAFNAFAIGLWQAVRSQHITTLPQSFLAALQQQVKQIPRGGGALTFEDVAHWLQQCDSQSVQSALHGVLRFVAIQSIRARGELDADYCAALDVAFHSPQLDDVFRHHMHVMSKFQQLRAAETAAETVGPELRTWWATTGRAAYLNNMAAPAANAADRARWGSEVELHALALALELTIAYGNIGALDRPRPLGCDSGTLGDLAAVDAQLPDDLGVGTVGSQDQCHLVPRSVRVTG